MAKDKAGKAEPTWAIDSWEKQKELSGKMLDVLLKANPDGTGQDQKRPGQYGYEHIEKARREEFEATGSPLVIWQFIKLSSQLATAEAETFPDRPRRAFFNPLPPWVASYLIEVAFGIGALRNERDPRAKPPPGAPDGEFAAWWENSRITPDAALRALPEILGLSRKGWNAFTEDQKSREDEILLYWAEIGDPGDGKTKSARIAEISSLLGHSDDRHVKRRLQRFVRAKGNFWKVAKPTPKD